MPVPETSPVELYFPRAGDQADQVLAEFIRGPTDQLRLAIYSLNRPVIVAAILEQHKAGVPLRLITDHVQSFGPGQLATLRELQAAGVPIKVNHHSGLMHLKMAVRQDVVAFGCHSEDTEVLTRSGWKLHDEWRTGEQILGFDPKAEQFTWTIPSVLHSYDYDGDMLAIQAQGMRALVTPNHRLYIKPVWKLPKGRQTKSGALVGSPVKYPREWSVILAEQVRRSSFYLPYANPVEPNPEAATVALADKMYPGVPFARFLGWWLSEGHVAVKTWTIHMAQAPGPVAEAMIETMEELGLPIRILGRIDPRPRMGPMVYISTRGRSTRSRDQTPGPLALAQWLDKEGGHGAANKRIPDDVWSWHPRLQTALLEALIDGDGHRFDADRSQYATASKQLADDVQRLAILLGKPANVFSAGVRQKGTLPRFNVNIGRPERRTLAIRGFRHIQTTSYRGRVYCFTVPTDSYLTRRQGRMFVSGNSFNWTNNAEALNDEVLGIFTDGEQIARAAWVFDCMWDDARRFVDWHPPTAAEMGAMLTERPDLLQMPEF